MGELTKNIALSEVMENSCIHESHTHTIHAYIRSQEYIEAIIHYSEASLGHRVARVFEITLIKVNLTEVNDWVILAEPIVRNLFICYFNLARCLWIRWLSSRNPREVDLESSLVLYPLRMICQKPDWAFVCARKCPIRNNLDFGEVLDLGDIFLLPDLSLFHLHFFRD